MNGKSDPLTVAPPQTSPSGRGQENDPGSFWNNDRSILMPFPQPLHEVDVSEDVRIPMSDGIGLYADIYRPNGMRGPLPTILIRTQYDKAPYRQRGLNTRPGVAYMFAGQGFAVVAQDIRGRHRSEGVFHIAESDVDDGYDTVAWIASQPWSNGKVGGFGCSALGITQVMMSQRRPPALAAIIPQAPAGSARNNPFDTMRNGVPRIGWTFQWFRESANQGPQILNAIDYGDFLDTLPLADMAERAGGAPNDWCDWVTHEPGDPYWRRLPFFDETSRPDVPALWVNSWHDDSPGETLELFNAFKIQSASEQARRNQFAIISPTTHCQCEQARTPHIVGDRDLGDVRQDYWSIYLHWFDHWLNNRPGDLNIPPIQYYLMGANRWKSADSWPLPGTRLVPYYFSSGGRANTSNGDGRLSVEGANGPADHFNYDPANPTPGTQWSGFDERETDLRPDRLVYTSEPLRSGIEVTGPLRACLYVSSSALDTDFVVTLSDVYPDGRVYSLATGIARARYREAYTAATCFGEDYSRPSLLTPGNIYRIEVKVGATGNWFGPGHRIRVQVASSHFPTYARNLNTGGNNATETAMVVAENHVHHDSSYPSHIILPIVP
ncbi:CocE/NonD family hydrolase [Mesorhizobium calcicola]|uniref:CocE/NonD family hydrolase n=1 Tax=Mesorhizobium calcicola TaxID=1300310 RepID=A0ABW4WS60_9HYPH